MTKKEKEAQALLIKESKQQKKSTRERIANNIAIQKKKLTPHK